MKKSIFTCALFVLFIQIAVAQTKLLTMEEAIIKPQLLGKKSIASATTTKALRQSAISSLFTRRRQSSRMDSCREMMSLELDT